MLTLPSIARALGGTVTGGQVLAPGPGHSPKDRSLSVRVSPAAPDGILVCSHAGDDWRSAKDYVLGRLGIAPDRGTAPRVETRPARPIVEDDDAAARRRRALALWSEAVDPAGTVVARYLASRKLDLRPDVAGRALRFHAACPFGEGTRVPAMVAAYRSIHSDALQAIHRTALTPGGAKVGRKMLGPAGGAAVKLDADSDVTVGLSIGEGIETCLAARELGFRPVWALGSVGAIRVFPVLAGIGSLTILAEVDDSGASEAAAEECGARWHAAGRDVTIARPRRGDMNDVLRARAQ